MGRLIENATRGRLTSNILTSFVRPYLLVQRLAVGCMTLELRRRSFVTIHRLEMQVDMGAEGGIKENLRLSLNVSFGLMEANYVGT